MRKFIKSNLAAAVIIGCMVGVVQVAHAGPFTARTDVSSVRSYLNGAYFITLASPALKLGGSCTTVYKVVAEAAGAKTIIATLLSAKIAGNQVEVEIPACNGWGTEIISVVVY